MKRINIGKIVPEATNAIMALEAYMKTTSLSTTIKELIKIRASQINGCAYCIDLHTETALKNGETYRRIFALSVWRESNLFSEEERCVLQLTEEITSISKQGVSDETYNVIIDKYGEIGLAELTMAIITINSWNRIALTTKLTR